MKIKKTFLKLISCWAYKWRVRQRGGSWYVLHILACIQITGTVTVKLKICILCWPLYQAVNRIFVFLLIHWQNSYWHISLGHMFIAHLDLYIYWLRVDFTLQSRTLLFVIMRSLWCRRYITYIFMRAHSKLKKWTYCDKSMLYWIVWLICIYKSVQSDCFLPSWLKICQNMML